MLRKQTRMTRILMGITDDASGVIGRRTLPLLIGMTLIRHLMDPIHIIMHIRRCGITPIAHFIVGTGIIMGTVRRIIATIAAIIRIETSTGGITVEVGIHRFHGEHTKKAIYDLKIGVRGVHAA